MSTATLQSESLTAFLRWAVDRLDWEMREAGGSVHLTVPEEYQSTFDDRTEIELPSGTGQGDAALAGKLARLLRERGEPLDSRPAAGPTSVHEITERLFSAYQIDGGRVHLGGCNLDDRPFVRQTFLPSGGELTHRYFDAAGHPADDETVENFGLDDLAVYEGKPPRDADVAVELLAPGDDDFLIATRVWCKYASGKLVFTVGKAHGEVSFAGWARTLEAPPFVCPYTGASSFHLAATDDGRMTAAEQIVRCDISGTRTIATDLVTCAATGRRVLPEFAETCPVTGDPVLRTELVTCRDCHQTVSPTALASGRCRACREIASVTKDDPRIVSSLDRYPGLRRWSRWRLAETASVTIFRGSTLLKQILIVIDNRTHEPHSVLERTRPLGKWRDVSREEQVELLGVSTLA